MTQCIFRLAGVLIVAVCFSQMNAQTFNATSIDLGPDVMICEGETVTIDGTISGPFNLIYVWNTGETTSTITVTPGLTTSYSVTATDNNTGVSSTDTITVTVITSPLGDPSIQGITSICKGELSTYTVQPVSGATNYNWTLYGGGIILSGQGTTSIEVDWDQATGGQVELVVSNLCGSLPATLLNVSIVSPPIIQGGIAGTTIPCTAGSTEYSIAPVAGADSYQWIIPGNALITSGQGTTNITINWNGSAGGNVCVIASNECGTSLPVYLTINTTPSPYIDAGNDQVNCGLETMLNGTGNGMWTFVSGTGTATLFNANANNTSVEVSSPGHYVFKFSASENGCISSDDVSLVFYEVPSIQNEVKDCNDINSGYTVSFDITGGVSPYLVNFTSSFSGGTYTSGLIPSGDPYSFIVTDAYGCVSEEISGQLECTCTTRAGMMDLTLIEACEDVQINANYLGGEILDGNDKLAFILHDGNIPGGIIAWNSVPKFQFVSPITLGITYYISAVVGDEGADGWPLLNDPCAGISEGAPIIFYGFPDFGALVTPPLCPGECTGIIEIQSTETGLQYEFGDRVFTTNNIFNNACSGVITVSIMNAAGCLVDSNFIIIEPPLLEVDLGFDQNINQGDSVVLTAEVSSSVIQYNWFDASSCLICPEITISPASSALYQIEVSDINGCTATDEVEIKVNNATLVANKVFVPTAITPNNDGINDEFFVQGSKELISIKSLQIFNRLGNKVFELKNVLPDSRGWDGTYLGSVASAGVYVYLIRAVFANGDEEVLHGDVTVVR